MVEGTNSNGVKITTKEIYEMMVDLNNNMIMMNQKFENMNEKLEGLKYKDEKNDEKDGRLETRVGKAENKISSLITYVKVNWALIFLIVASILGLAFGNFGS